MRQLTENNIDHGGNLILTHHVLGDPRVAENIISWSMKVEPGETFEKTTAWGLKLTAVANTNNPAVVMEFDEEKFHSFLRTLGPVSVFKMMAYGVTITGPQNQTPAFNKDGTYILVLWLGKDEEHIIPLHQVDPYENNLVTLGTILIGEEGFNFIDEAEMEALGIQNTKEQEQSA